MKKNGERIAMLHQLIAEHAFVTKRDARIVDTNGQEQNWLVDMRRILFRQEALMAIADAFLSRFHDRFPLQVGGLETAGIPIVTALSLILGGQGYEVNGFYIRKSRKKSGLLQVIEGNFTSMPVILVDDILNTGGSLLRAVEILEHFGAKVTDVFVVLRYRDSNYYTHFRERGIAIHSIFTLNDFAPYTNLPSAALETESPPAMPFSVRWYFKSEHPDLFYIAPKSAPICWGEYLYVGADNGYFWALDASNGTVVWKYRVGLWPKGKHIFSTPVVAKNLVCFGAYDGNVYALDTQTGERRWIFMEGDWVRSSPVYSSKTGLLFISLEFGLFSKQGGIVALDAVSGTKRWEHLGTSACSSPAISERFHTLLVGGEDGDVHAYNMRSGKLYWTFHAGESIPGSFAIDESDGVASFGTLGGVVHVVRISDGKPLAKFDVDGGVYGTPLLAGHLLYVPTLGKKFYAFDLKRHLPLWTFNARSRVFSTPVLIDGEIVFGANDGRLYFLDTATGRHTAMFQTTERIVNAVAHDASKRRIYLSTQANEIYCIERAVEGKEDSR